MATMIQRLCDRIKGAIRTFRILRTFNVNVLGAAWLALRFSFTGVTGKFRLPFWWQR